MPNAAAQVTKSSASSSPGISIAHASGMVQSNIPSNNPDTRAMTFHVACVPSEDTASLHWTTHVHLWVPSAVALVAAGFASYFAWRQSKTAKDKLTLDLFKDRLEVFNATFEVFTAKLHSGEEEPSLEYLNFYKAKVKAGFLFGPDVQAYLESVHQKVQEIRMSTAMYKAAYETIREPSHLEGDARAAAAHEAKCLVVQRTEAVSWLISQHEKCQEVFGRYMAFGTLR